QLAAHRYSRKEQRDRRPALCTLANQRISRRYKQPVISKCSQSGSAKRVPTIPRQAISRPGRQAPKRHQRGDYSQQDRPNEPEGRERSCVGEDIGRTALAIALTALSLSRSGRILKSTLVLV